MNTNVIHPGSQRTSNAVELAKERFREAAAVRLARITNNAEPDYKNGHPKASEKTGCKTGRCGRR